MPEVDERVKQGKGRAPAIKRSTQTRPEAGDGMLCPPPHAPRSGVRVGSLILRLSVCHCRGIEAHGGTITSTSSVRFNMQWTRKPKAYVWSAKAKRDYYYWCLAAGVRQRTTAGVQRSCVLVRPTPQRFFLRLFWQSRARGGTPRQRGIPYRILITKNQKKGNTALSGLCTPMCSEFGPALQVLLPQYTPRSPPKSPRCMCAGL